MLQILHLIIVVIGAEKKDVVVILTIQIGTLLPRRDDLESYPKCDYI